MNMLSIDVSTDTDACVEPVLSLREASQHPHNKSVTSSLVCLLVDGRFMLMYVGRGESIGKIKKG